MSAPADVPAFRTTLTVAGVLFVLLAVMNLVRGPADILAPFGFAPELLGDPLFGDFFHWLFVHMATIGVLIVLLGRLVDGRRRQTVVAWTLLAALLHYGYLDLSTSVWGSGLYADPASLVIVAMDAAFVLAVGHVCVRSVLVHLRPPEAAVEG